MALLWILLYAPAVVLLLRVFTSRDPGWVRLLGAVAAAASVALPLGAQAAGWDLSAGLGVTVLGAAASYLLVWSAFSRDGAAVRLACAAVAVAGAFPLLLLYLFATHYTE
ncbi:MAG TPA: hypothetical protein VF547_07700 [Allosphingosinicella sp.]|jgi:hypothetical protein